MKKQFFALFVTIILIQPSAVQAARSIVISADKTSLINDEEMIVSASVSGFTQGEKIYTKGAFFLDGSSNYFGYTKNNDQWVKNSESAVNQKQVEIGNWDLNTNVKGDHLDSGFIGKGEYNFKLGYYYITSGGNISSINWSENILKITLDPPLPTNTNTPTSKSSQISSLSVSKTTAPSLAISRTPTPTQFIEKTTYSTKSSNFDKIQSEITGSSYNNLASISQDKKEDREIKVLGTTDEKNFSWLWIIIGIIFFISGAGVFVYKIAKERNML